MLAASTISAPAADEQYGEAADVAEPNRLPLLIALPVIATMSAGLWVLVWKAGREVVSLFN